MEQIVVFTCILSFLTSLDASFFQREKMTVYRENIIGKVKASLTQCHLKCQMNKDCVGYGTVENMPMGNIMECYLIRSDRGKYASNSDVKDESYELYVVEMEGIAGKGSWRGNEFKMSTKRKTPPTTKTTKTKESTTATTKRQPTTRVTTKIVTTEQSTIEVTTATKTTEEATIEITTKSKTTEQPTSKITTTTPQPTTNSTLPTTASARDAKDYDCIEKNVYYGQKSMQEVPENGSWEKCSKRCFEDERCVQWIWIDGPTVDRRKCFMVVKESHPTQRIQLPGMTTIAGPKQCGAYKFSEEAKKWKTANEDCKRWGGILAAPPNEDENTELMYKIKYRTGFESIWLGITDMHAEGFWMYEHSKAIAWQPMSKGTPQWNPWQEGGPNGNSDSDCVELRREGKWNAKNCERKRNYICTKNS